MNTDTRLKCAMYKPNTSTWPYVMSVAGKGPMQPTAVYESKRQVNCMEI